MAIRIHVRGSLPVDPWQRAAALEPRMAARPWLLIGSLRESSEHREVQTHPPEALRPLQGREHGALPRSSRGRWAVDLRLRGLLEPPQAGQQALPVRRDLEEPQAPLRHPGGVGLDAPRSLLGRSHERALRRRTRSLRRRSPRALRVEERDPGLLRRESCAVVAVTGSDPKIGPGKKIRSNAPSRVGHGGRWGWRVSRVGLLLRGGLTYHPCPFPPSLPLPSQHPCGPSCWRSSPH